MLKAIKEDWYYHLLVPAMVPVTFIAVRRCFIGLPPLPGAPAPCCHLLTLPPPLSLVDIHQLVLHEAIQAQLVSIMVEGDPFHLSCTRVWSRPTRPEALQTRQIKFALFLWLLSLISFSTRQVCGGETPQCLSL